MKDRPTEARQDELVGIREKIAEVWKNSEGNYGLTYERFADQILSLTVSSGGGVCPKCEGKKTVPNYGWVNEPTRLERVDITCPTCNGTGQKPIVTKTLGQLTKEHQSGQGEAVKRNTAADPEAGME